MGPDGLSNLLLPGCFAAWGHLRETRLVVVHFAWWTGWSILALKGRGLGRSGGCIAGVQPSKVAEYRHRRFAVELHCGQGTALRVSDQTQVLEPKNYKPLAFA